MVTKYISIIAFPAAFGLFWFALPIITIIFGPEYTAAAVILSILSFLIIDTALGGLYSPLFTSKERPDYPAKVMIVSLSLNIILNLLLIVNFGIVGIAIATVVSRYFNTIVLAVLMKKKMNIYPDFSSIVKPLMASLIMVGFMIIIPQPNNISILILSIISSAAVYFITMALIKGITLKDYIYIKTMLGKSS